ncbi:MAG: small multi-drug export protein [Deinococcota bacterium]|jgi:uncharacterized membrane protein|nr:small multi-drug export protein [Deinococcota bacterium]
MTWVLEYTGKAATAWFLGFFPFFEIYVAVPAAIAMGLDYTSAVVWPALGNFTPVLLIVFAYEKLARHPQIGDWLTGRRSERFERLVNRYGSWFILVITPWVGVWIVAATARALGMKRSALLLYSLLSIVLYAVTIAAAVALGLEAFAQR